MKQNNMVSIIVPVYNAEDYLKNCLDSILNQTYKNLEVILINDGSTDKSGVICDQYAKDSEKIKVIHQQNSGPSIARNKGILAAEGKYIQFVDSDDSLELNMTGNLVESKDKLKQLVICGYNVIEKRKGQFVKQKRLSSISNLYNKKSILKNFGKLFAEGLISSPCNKLYDAQIIQNKKLAFMEHTNIGEDLLFNIKYIQEISSIQIVNETLYNYMKYNNSNSLTGDFKSNYFENQKYLFSVIQNFLHDENSYNGDNHFYLGLTYSNRIIGALNNLFHGNSKFPTNSIKKEIKEIVSDKSVRSNLSYFQKRGLKVIFIGILIKFKLVNAIYCFFKLRQAIKKT